ncbi:hypothetical protein DICPUDRAFT_149347 [Dictyostelium purpureum]|uniref:non-specific serine/threonine protein kinase n=1 Tax=Dictyostelium purpureum TaxID=5786 RepID=F0ZDG7_DICPU|nr:uncharacterized protein DICPUDRAFT_149347 [Dictyostelium purpureum]EGC37997.1 hypothetical protein DICPUDRAFT_149347 [Dictyostelium purpureum]|eukprot:XP_003285481.1 hypothetical protein DICPUDRAFT_149347 [Dictyostelium purpureum]
MLKDIYNSLLSKKQQEEHAWSLNEDILENQAQLFFSLKSIKGLKIDEPVRIYCLASLEKQSIQTSSIIVRDQSPIEWNEGYTFDVISSKSVLALSIWQGNFNQTNISDSSSKNNNDVKMGSPVISGVNTNLAKLIGKVYIPFLTFKKQFCDQWFPLNGSPSVSIHVKLSFTNSGKKVSVNDFIYLRMIGRGAFGQVNLVKKIDTGRLYAMKIIKKDRCLNMNAVGHTFTERKLLKKYYHPFIVGLKYSFQTQDSLCMVLDYIGGGELFYHISERETFSEETARFYISQIMLAIGFLHEHGVIYRDLKLENLLMDLDGNICLVDLGLCKEDVKEGQYCFTMCGSPEYVAPEIITGTGYSRSVDWWALGTLFYEMIAGLPPFYSEDPHEMSKLILSSPLKFPPNISKNAASLISLLLNRDPTKRLGSGESDVEEIKAHPFFKSMNWSKLLNKEVDPPFKPHLIGPLDLSYFDPACTLQSQPINPYTTNSNLSESDQMAFQGFSYSAPDIFNLTNNNSSGSIGVNTSSGGSAQNSPYNSLRNTPPSFMKISGSNIFENGRMSPISFSSSPSYNNNNNNNNNVNMNHSGWVQPQSPQSPQPLPQLPILSKLQETTFERRRSLSVNAQTQFTMVLGDDE